MVVVNIKTNLRLLAEGLYKYVYTNFCYRQLMIIVYGIRAKSFGINLARKYVIYQKLAKFM